MSNTFNISVKPEIAANLVQILLNATALGTIDGIVDAIKLKTDIIGATVALESSGNISAIKTKTDIIGASVALESSGNISAIKLKTDATPQPIRGKMFHAQLTTSSATLQDVVNVSGHGKLDQVSIQLANSADTIEIVITLDGIAFTAFTYTGDTICQFIYPSVSVPSSSAKLLNRDPYSVEIVPHFNIEFQASLLVQARRSLGTGGNVYAKVHYTEDQF